MKTILQHEEFGCGAASVALLCGVDLEDALRVFKSTNWKMEGAGKIKLKRAFDALGFIMHDPEIIPSKSNVLIDIKDNLLLWGAILPCQSEISWNPSARRTKVLFAQDVALNPSVNTVGEVTITAFDHWAVWDGKEQVVRDPYGYRAMFVPAYFHRITKKP